MVMASEREISLERRVPGVKDLRALCIVARRLGNVRSWALQSLSINRTERGVSAAALHVVWRVLRTGPIEKASVASEGIA